MSTKQETPEEALESPISAGATETQHYPTKDEFRHLLQDHNIDWIIDQHLFDGLPFYSSRKPSIHHGLLHAISTGLNIGRTDIRVIGSARIGFSLSPEKFGEPFSGFSDIDVIVVSSCLFDGSWIDLLSTRRGRLASVTAGTRKSLRIHRERHYVYNGWMYPDSVIEVLREGHRWLQTFRGLSRITELAGRKVSARLYRTWDHARLYHRWSLEKVRQSLID